MNGKCPNCANDTSLILGRRMENVEIRGEVIPVEFEIYHCDACGEEFEIDRPGYDPAAIAYEEYRRRKGFVTPEEIRSFRKKYGLTQKELSGLLGIGLVSLNRYENGALQDDAHDRILRLGMDTHNLRKLIEDNPEAVKKETRREIIDQIEQEEREIGTWMDLFLELYGIKSPDIFTGYKRFDFQKFIQVVKFFCFNKGVYKTKLMKLLFYTDFKHFKEYDVSITGSRYAHLPHGPVPDQFNQLFSLILEEEPSISYEEVWFYENPSELYSSQTQPDLSFFSAAEIKTLATIKERFDEINAKEISEFSHKEKGYQETKNGELISYQYAEYLSV